MCACVRVKCKLYYSFSAFENEKMHSYYFCVCSTCWLVLFPDELFRNELSKVTTETVGEKSNGPALGHVSPCFDIIGIKLRVCLFLNICGQTKSSHSYLMDSLPHFPICLLLKVAFIFLF